jgi:hypothetical protein|tara:strand:+ start:6058 stop:6501 length:444 start_codon:yes stop_codon:yes gene_type:complete
MNKDKAKLNERQEKFCQLYVNGDKELFGNGVQSYLEVYEIDKTKKNWYKTACAATSQLLSNIKVIDRIKDLLETGGFNDENVEKQHLFLLNQHSDYGVKMRALADYYKLKGKYAPIQTDITTKGEKIDGIQMVNPYEDKTKTNEETV